MAKKVFYYGSMNSSKSAQAIMTIHNFQAQGKSTLVFKSSLDTRDDGYISSRAIKTRIPANLIDVTMNGVMSAFAKEQKPDFVFVDEVQFLTEAQVEELDYIVDVLGIDVICYGLLTDFQGQLFEGSKRLVETADSIREIKNQCYHCKNKANRNMRLLEGVPVYEGETVQVGAEESYRSVCRRCYNEFRKRAEETKLQHS